MSKERLPNPGANKDVLSIEPYQYIHILNLKTNVVQ